MEDKKKFEKPEVIVLEVDVNGVITASDGPFCNTDAKPTGEKCVSELLKDK